MALSDAAMVVAANALRGAITHAQLHSGAPGAAGTSNVCSGSRQAVTWAAATSDGDFALSSALNFTGIAGSGAVQYVSFWSASTAGTFYGSYALSGDSAANAAGEYTVTAITLNGSST
jgi:hypothetical protein